MHIGERIKALRDARDRNRTKLPSKVICPRQQSQTMQPKAHSQQQDTYYRNKENALNASAEVWPPGGSSVLLVYR